MKSLSIWFDYAMRQKKADPGAVLVRYAAIAAAVRGADLAPDDMVGDLTVRQLRGRFGSSRTKKGLVLVDGTWLSPSRVLLGRPIFGNRRAFAPNLRSLERLWRLLKISPPALQDCIEVLTELVSESVEANENVIVNTYLYLDERLKGAKPKETQLLSRLPLWTTDGWRVERPIYALEDSVLARSLAGQAPVWLPPVQLRAIPNLLEACGVTILPTAAFEADCTQGAFAIGEAHRDQWAAAVALLRDWLTRHDPRLAVGIDVWPKLAAARLAIDPDLRLSLKLPGQRRISAKSISSFVM